MHSNLSPTLSLKASKYNCPKIIAMIARGGNKRPFIVQWCKVQSESENAIMKPNEQEIIIRVERRLAFCICLLQDHYQGIQVTGNGVSGMDASWKRLKRLEERPTFPRDEMGSILRKARKNNFWVYSYTNVQSGVYFSREII